MPHILFICTANYYRSRFAELLFNHLAAEAELRWTSISRGVATELGADNDGPISPNTIRALQARGVALPDTFRDPIQLTAADLRRAAFVIALDEDEHRPCMEMKFPDWADKITYWRIGDLHVSTADEALEMAEKDIRILIQRFSMPIPTVTQLQRNI